MDKQHKKDLEQLLLHQTEKILNEIDPAVAVIFNKHIKIHCKDIAKKFLKAQKKFNKQMEVLKANQVSTALAASLPSATGIKETKSVKAVVKSNSLKKSTLKPITLKETPKKRTRRGNNLFNAAVVQRKAKTTLAKSITKSSKK